MIDILLDCMMRSPIATCWPVGPMNFAQNQAKAHVAETAEEPCALETRRVPESLSLGFED